MADHLFARSFDQSELRDQFLREGGMAKIMGFSSVARFVSFVAGDRRGRSDDERGQKASTIGNRSTQRQKRATYLNSLPPSLPPSLPSLLVCLSLSSPPLSQRLIWFLSLSLSLSLRFPTIKSAFSSNFVCGTDCDWRLSANSGSERCGGSIHLLPGAA